MLKNIADKNEHMECIWLGYIPRDWEVERLQWHLYEINDKNNPIITENILSLTNKKGVIPYEEKGDQGNKSKESIDEYKIAHKDTIVANSMNILIGSVGYCNYEGCVSPVYYVFKEKKENNLYFINYIMQTAEFQKMLRNYANGILEIRMRVSSNDILKRKVAFPSIDEQNKIVSFLDSKCQKIDDTIEKINKQIEVLKKYKQSLITEVVTKGLDKNAPMKDSGVDWIGKIPKEWEVKRLKYTCKQRNEKNSLEKELDYFALENVESWNFRYIETENEYDITESNICNKNDVVFGKLRPYLAKTFLVDYDRCCSSEFVIFYDFSGLQKFLLYILTSYGFVTIVDSSTYGTKMPRASVEFIKNMRIPLPKPNEQEKIVSYLDKKCVKIDNILDKKSKQIEILERYKKSLIYEYVTGKKRVK